MDLLKMLAAKLQVFTPQQLRLMSNRTCGIALTHPDDVLPISLSRWVIELNDMDGSKGYTVHDQHHALFYIENSAPDLFWGNADADINLVYGLGVGEFVYLTYHTRGDGDERTLMLVKVR